MTSPLSLRGAIDAPAGASCAFLTVPTGGISRRIELLELPTTTKIAADKPYDATDGPDFATDWPPVATHGARFMP